MTSVICCRKMNFFKTLYDLQVTTTMFLLGDRKNDSNNSKVILQCVPISTFQNTLWKILHFYKTNEFKQTDHWVKSASNATRWTILHTFILLFPAYLVLTQWMNREAMNTNVLCVRSKLPHNSWNLLLTAILVSKIYGQRITL